MCDIAQLRLLYTTKRCNMATCYIAHVSYSTTAILYIPLKVVIWHMLYAILKSKWREKLCKSLEGFIPLSKILA